MFRDMWPEARVASLYMPSHGTDSAIYDAAESSRKSCLDGGVH